MNSVPAQSNLTELEEGFRLLRIIAEDMDAQTGYNSLAVKVEMMQIALQLEQAKSLERIADSLKELVGR